ncbi:MAG: hypothetical protein D6760_10040 [Deltaproteobacteria bacterium]|nr:MAG: hypothetical protein D6760_10040 [Deltaproteobacteria bacterium]
MSSKRSCSAELTRAVVSHLADLIGAGLPACDALRAGAALPGRCGRTMAAIAARVGGGERLASALGKAGLALSPAELAIVGAGERGGNLTATLFQLRDLLSERAELRAQVTRTAAYPTLLVLLTLAVVTAAGQFILPSIAAFHRQQGAQLPVLTRLLLASSDALVRWAPLLLPALVLCAAAYSLARRAPRLRVLSDHAVLALPLAGRLVAQGERGRFYALVAALLATGSEIDAALAMATPTVANSVIRAQCVRARQLLLKGMPISVAVARSGLDPSGEDRALLSVAEAGVGFHVCFSRLAAAAAARRSHTLALAARLAEPIAVSFVALAAGATVLAVYQPLLGTAGLLAEAMP